MKNKNRIKNQKLRIMGKAKIFPLAFLYCFLLFPSSVSAVFDDIDVTHPYYHAISALQEEGILEGYKKGDQAFFRPLQPVIRAEAVKVLGLSSGISKTNNRSDHFVDVPPDAWYASYVNAAADAGIIEGFADGNFHPSAQVSRSEFLKMLVLSFHVPVEEESPDETWYDRFFRATANLRIIEDPTISPYESVSRGEMAELIYRTEKVVASNFQKKYSYAASGKASFYGEGFAGRSTANGEKYDPTDLTAAHRTLPFGTFLKVSREGKSVVVRVNDRGPYHGNRVLDLSEKAFSLLAPLSKGIITVDFEVVSSPGEETSEIPDYIRTKLSVQAKSAPLPAPIAEKIAGISTNFPDDAVKIPLFSGTVSHLAKNFFPNATLRRSIPQRIPMGTVINFSGTVFESGHKKATVFLQNLDETAAEKQTHFSGLVSGKNFAFPVFFTSPGKFYIGLVFDDEKKSRVEAVEIIPLEKERKFSKLDVAFSSDIAAYVTPEDSKVTFEWTTPKSTLSRLDFEQNGKKKSLFMEDRLDQINLPYSFFSDFLPGASLTVTLFQGLSEDGTLTNQATNWKTVANRNYDLWKGFPDTAAKNIEVFNFPRFPKNLGPIILEGKKISGQKMKEYAFVITPSGFVQEFPVEARGTDGFRVEIALEEWGTHIVEFISEGGEILFNRAMYVSKNFVLPVIPRTQTVITSETEAGMLYWINTLRHAHAVPSLILSGDMSRFAQNYANKMAKENFISHTDPSGFSFEQRTKKSGLKGEFGENLSFGSTLKAALSGLENSASHRGNILRRKWTKVGIGLAQNIKGEWYTVQMFGQ